MVGNLASVQLEIQLTIVEIRVCQQLRPLQVRTCPRSAHSHSFTHSL